jgi:hypothetical protein
MKKETGEGNKDNGEQKEKGWRKKWKQEVRRMKSRYKMDEETDGSGE